MSAPASRSVGSDVRRPSRRTRATRARIQRRTRKIPALHCAGSDTTRAFDGPGLSGPSCAADAGKGVGSSGLRWGADRGSVSVDMVLGYIPIMILVILAVVTCVRLASAASDVNAAAAAAARAASFARSPGSAVSAGQAAAADTLTGRKITCQPSSVSVDTSVMFPGGQVAVTVRCTVTLADLTGLHLPGTTEVSSTARQPIDLYRGVTP